jgi:hypothetical protein
VFFILFLFNKIKDRFFLKYMSYFKIVDDYYVVEYDNQDILNYWNLYELKKNQDSISKLDRRSFTRAKKWLLKNHPEYIL